MNYCQERLQMLFHDSTFTSEQDRYIQESINWVFSELATSPLAVIDTIDKHVPQVGGGEAGRWGGGVLVIGWLPWFPELGERV